MTFMSFLVPIFCEKKKLDNGNKKGQKFQFLEWFFSYNSYLYLLTRVAKLLNNLSESVDSMLALLFIGAIKVGNSATLCQVLKLP